MTVITRSQDDGQSIFAAVERCGCTPHLDPLPFDLDGDGIGELCRRCGEYIALVAQEGIER